MHSICHVSGHTSQENAFMIVPLCCVQFHNDCIQFCSSEMQLYWLIGTNSFHKLLSHCIVSIFLPNSAHHDNSCPHAPYQLSTQKTSVSATFIFEGASTLQQGRKGVSDTTLYAKCMVCRMEFTRHSVGTDLQFW